MNYNYLHIVNLAILLLFFPPLDIYAQKQNESLKNASYYISLNADTPSKVHDLQEASLSMEYHDRYGRKKEMTFSIYDHKRTLITALVMDKSFGLNHYTIDLRDIQYQWKTEQTYSGEIVDDVGRRHQLLFRLIPAPEKEKPVVNIVVNPLDVACNGVDDNVIEYYGKIEGGNAPYRISWFVLNEQRTELIYQPDTKLIKDPTQTMMIQVDEPPGYSVVLHVVDACGMEQQQMANVICEKGRKKINTLFLEEVEPPVKKGGGS
ncbi:hypothetical protein FNH22_12680 [Fulvivirga sp. M361]|uniref:hypothetical protein n=1 Tax=Fulvivirga sp. M361 TaxID=2594266 RepID=UPI00117B42AA|nr:hypothetical protein [Fulvivirga sp. M361]TRX58726.1 hypothetical protein FNH22_12680 [Fulvivirga sp. M361]